MSRTKWSIEIEDENGLECGSCIGLSRIGAITMAKSERKKPENKNNKIFIRFFRSFDGQHGFLNPDGCDITGKSW
jgi:hypothetical protein